MTGKGGLQIGSAKSARAVRAAKSLCMQCPASSLRRTPTLQICSLKRRRRASGSSTLEQVRSPPGLNEHSSTHSKTISPSPPSRLPRRWLRSSAGRSFTPKFSETYRALMRAAVADVSQGDSRFPLRAPAVCRFVEARSARLGVLSGYSRSGCLRQAVGVSERRRRRRLRACPSWSVFCTCLSLQSSESALGFGRSWQRFPADPN